MDKAKQSSLSRTVTLYYALSMLNNIGYIIYVRNFVKLYEEAFPDKSILSSVLKLTHGDLEFMALTLGVILGAILEIPAGIYSDRKGADRGIKLSLLLFLLHGGLYLAAAALTVGNYSSLHNRQFLFIPLVILGEALLAGGAALLQAALNSWLMKWLIYLNCPAEERPTFIINRRLAINATFLVFGNPILYKYIKIEAAYMLAASAYLGCYLIAMRSVCLPPKQINDAQEELEATSWATLKGAVGEIRHNPHLRLLLIAYMPAYLSGLIAFYYWDDIVAHFRTNWQEGITQDTLNFYFWFLMIALRIAGNAVARRVSSDKASKPLGVMQFGLLLIGLPVLLIALADGFYGHQSRTSLWPPILVGIAFAVRWFGQELCLPLCLAWLHKAIREEKYRATIESLFSSSSGILLAGIYLSWIPMRNQENSAVHLVLWSFLIAGLMLIVPAILFRHLWKSPVAAATAAGEVT